jgi:uncharacterized PurR-regulated membrane protein YhhQ (DUF165 family)
VRRSGKRDCSGAVILSLQDFLTRHFVQDETRLQATKSIRALAKGFLEFVRNLIVVAVLFVLAEKSGKWYLTTLSLLAGLALWSTVYSYIDPVVPVFGQHKTRWLVWLTFILAFLLLFLVVYGLAFAVNFALLEIVRVQSTKAL